MKRSPAPQLQPTSPRPTPRLAEVRYLLSRRVELAVLSERRLEEAFLDVVTPRATQNGYAAPASTSGEHQPPRHPGTQQKPRPRLVCNLLSNERAL